MKNLRVVCLPGISRVYDRQTTSWGRKRWLSATGLISLGMYILPWSYGSYTLVL